jgi:hypothetical protein
VLEDFMRRYEQIRNPIGHFNINFEIWGCFYLDEGRKTFPVKVHHTYRIAPLDIAILSLAVPTDWPKDHVWRVPEIDLSPPPVGTPVAAFGFSDSRVERTSEVEPPTIMLHPRTTTGQVIEIHHQFRDSVLLPFPCFRTNIRSEHGMSGGPVFNNLSGRVCGVICSSMPPTRDDQDHDTFASTLWPVVMTILDPAPENLGEKSRFPFMELFEKGILTATHLDNVKLVQAKEGSVTASAQYSQAAWDNPSSTG